MCQPSLAGNHSLSLKRIADELLSGQEGEDRLSAAVRELYSLCSSVTGIDESSTHADDSAETVLSSGKAISPRDAARCVLDYSRTSKFLKGLHAAILEARKRFPDTVIDILYAGCGPFAPLVIPLTSRFSPAEIQFTLLDIHKRSLDAAQRIFQALGLTSFVRDFIQCDAASYKHDAPHVIHIALAEAMQGALEKESQVAITMNLAPQLCRGGIFIPQRIAVDCCACDLTKEFTLSPVGASLGSVLEITAGSVSALTDSAGGVENRGAPLSPKVILDVPMDLDGELNLMLLTNITVFDSIAIDYYESGLTCPRILHELGKVRGGTGVVFAYRFGYKPGFEYRLLER